MPYITVRNTPNYAAYPEHMWFVGTCTYIDCAYTNSASSLEKEIVSSLQASSAHGSDDDHYTIASGYYSYRSDNAPHEVLNVLEGYGYRVVAAITSTREL